MAPRKRFFVMFTTDPSAADIVREDQIIDIGRAENGAEGIQFRWEKARNVVEVVMGKVLQIGLRKDLVGLLFDDNGVLTDSKKKSCGTRKQELEKQRIARNSVKEINLQTQAKRILDNGAESLCDDLQPVVKRKRPSLPTKRSQALPDLLQSKVDGMPFFSPAIRKKPLLGDANGIYIDEAKLLCKRLRYRLRPGDLHGEILKLLIPEEILRLQGIRATGKRGCVAISPKINEVVALYVSKVFQKAGGDHLSTSYDPGDVLSNLMDNTRRLMGIIKLLDPETQEVVEEEGELNIEDPHELINPPPLAPHPPHQHDQPSTSASTSDHGYSTSSVPTFHSLQPAAVLEYQVPFDNF